MKKTTLTVLKYRHLSRTISPATNTPYRGTAKKGKKAGDIARKHFFRPTATRFSSITPRGCGTVTGHTLCVYWYKLSKKPK